VIRLDPETIDAIARRVADLLDEGSPLPRLLTAGEVAERLAVSEAWVRENADRLGGVRLADGSRPRLRFDPAAVAEALDLRCEGKGSPGGGNGSSAPRGGRQRRGGPAVIGQKVSILADAAD
jgi:hypothetical protein